LGVFGDVQIHEKGGFLFDVDFSLTDREITPSLQQRALEIVERRKNVRSVLDEFLLSYKTKSSLYVRAGAMGESESEAKMIDGFTNSANAFANIRAGAMGEAVAVARMEV